jgi:hypothetical protein
MWIEFDGELVNTNNVSTIIIGVEAIELYTSDAKLLSEETFNSHEEAIQRFEQLKFILDIRPRHCCE